MKKIKGKSVGLVCAFVLGGVVLVVGAIGGTMAWLVDTTESVENIFTVSDIDITLQESTGNTYKMIPGLTIAKDPFVQVLKDSEACYVFVKVDKSENFDTYMTAVIDTGTDKWTKLDGYDNVYYRQVEATGDDASEKFYLLENNQVSVKETVTKEQMDVLTESTYPTLTFTAYAVQLYGDGNHTIMDVLDAWDLVKR